MLTQNDKKWIWHPFTQEKANSPRLAITRGQGAYLFDESDRKYLDLISSWWVNLHGHSHPKIAKAIYRQAETLEHVLFAGFTHEPAVLLAEKLLSLLPRELSKLFFSDDGSTAVEVALKMAYQYWINRGETKRSIFLSFEGGYHGDTFGAMAVGASSGFYDPFRPLLFQVASLPFPYTWQGDEEVENKEEKALETLREFLKSNGDKTAAFIAEPLLQGASGMRMCRKSFLKRAVELVREYEILVIFDEVMTGFGRTGTLFALEQADITPDLLCLSKGLTGGFLPLSVTVCREFIYSQFLGDDYKNALLHGHSYTANPLGCRAALCSLELFEEEKTLEKIQMIHAIHAENLPKLFRRITNLASPRIIGTVAAWNIASPHTTYFSSAFKGVERESLKRGLLVRLLGNTCYFMPPYCIEKADLIYAYDTMGDILERLF